MTDPTRPTPDSPDSSATGNAVADEQASQRATLEEVVNRWLAAALSGESERREAMLDRAVRDTFPASDPIAPEASGDRSERLVALECHLARERLTLIARMVGEGSTVTRVGPEPDQEFETDGPAGMRLQVSVFDGSAHEPPLPAPRRSSETDVVDRPGSDDAASSAGGAGSEDVAGNIDWPAIERRLGERRRAARRAA